MVAVSAAVVAMAAVAGWDPAALLGRSKAKEAVVRVDQSGYVTGEVKVAAVMGDEEALAGAGFVVP
ncbi:hypothetical protein BSL84_34355 [Streptomyces sp. TN58]|nr:hypothetical protein BSL84_00150 [Streptomyces sp. TN58]APU44031.1 hypothetical protein BSL84_34355 [Streptomyces sp. TN58]